MKKILLSAFFIVGALFLPIISFARDAANITDWYIRDFQSSITLQNDSSLLIEEMITADCGNLPDKHGIFRILPTEIKTRSKTIKTPISLISITDFNGKNLSFSKSSNNFDHTITWKIGDPDKTVSGINYYKIRYLVSNAIIANGSNFDELYWNLTGNFWDIDIDNFAADIIFPDKINKNNTQIDYYTGNLGSKTKNSATYEWVANNKLEFRSSEMIKARQGITASITFPKNIVTPYKLNFGDMYGNYFWLILPLFGFVLSYLVWIKYGKDPQINKTIIPEFEIPENLAPMEMGLLSATGNFSDKLITAAIINLAVKRNIKIEEISKKGIFGKQDFSLTKIDGSSYAPGTAELILLNKIFGSERQVLISNLKNKFYLELPKIKKTAIDELKKQNLIYQSGLTLKYIFISLSVIIFFGMIFGLTAGNFWIISSFMLTGTIILIFGLLMPKRTAQGAELNWRIQGFRLYMETAEKYRAQFNEKENVFEKFLPYAIVFGMTKLWIKKTEDIYGKEYFQNYHPVWYAGALSSNFNADSFTSQINGLSSGIAANIGTTSGASGSGSSGGGGGGGGGGGW